jgi:hypothetical protein
MTKRVVGTPKPGDDSRRKLMEQQRHVVPMPKAWVDGSRDRYTPEYLAWHKAVLHSAPLGWRLRWRWYDLREWLARRIAPWAVKDITDA